MTPPPDAAPAATERPDRNRPRAIVLVTGSELVRGELSDLNGPFVARELEQRGIEPARIVIVGDRPDRLAAELRESLAAADLVVVSGGLGPTHDDRTVELLAEVAERGLVVDPGLEQAIAGVSKETASRLRRPFEEFVPGVRKQASIPEGAVSVGLAGTAPGLVLELPGRAVAVVLPGPPAELRRLWPAALASEPVRKVLARAHPPARRTLRFFGASESSVAAALADSGGERGGLEATICARDYEVRVDLVVGGGAEAYAEHVEQGLRARLAEYLFAADERPIEEIVLELCRSRSYTLATAESCTGGLVAGRLTSIPGASDVFLGAIVAYSDELKIAELGVPRSTIARYGSVSAETAAAMAAGAREHLGADVALAVTGVAGPGGGTPEKPVGLVHLHAATPDAVRGHELLAPGDRESVRSRAVVVGLHLVRRLLTQIRDEAA